MFLSTMLLEMSGASTSHYKTLSIICAGLVSLLGVLTVNVVVLLASDDGAYSGILAGALALLMLGLRLRLIVVFGP